MSVHTLSRSRRVGRVVQRKHSCRVVKCSAVHVGVWIAFLIREKPKPFCPMAGRARSDLVDLSLGCAQLPKIRSKASWNHRACVEPALLHYDNYPLTVLVHLDVMEIEPIGESSHS